MAEPILDSHFRTERRRGVSPVVAFFVVAASVAAVLAVALCERQAAYEAGVAIRLVAASATEAIAKPSEEELRGAYSKLYEAAPQDEIVDAATRGSGETGGSAKASNVVVVVRSDEASGLLERLNDAARRLVDAQNDLVAVSAEERIKSLRSKTAARRDEREGAAKRLEELERRRESGEGAGDDAATHDDTPSDAAANNAREKNREFNPQWVLLRDEVAALEAKVSELRGRFTEQHPEVQHALVALAERTSTFQATPQYLGAVDAPPANPSPVVAAPANPPLVAPQSDSLADAAPAGAEIEMAREKLADASAALDGAWSAEKAAEQRQTELAAIGPWRFDPAESVRSATSGATQTPWLVLLGAAVGAGLVASVLARGIAPVIETPEDAVAALGLKVVGIVRTDDPTPHVPADPGMVSAQWLTRAGVIVIAVSIAIAVIAANGTGIGIEELRRDPAVLLSLSRDWLTERLG